MIEAPSHLIDAGHGRVRVLRLVCADGHTWPLRYETDPCQGMCEYCGCTDRYGCEGGCYWVDLAHTVCSRCFTKEMLP